MSPNSKCAAANIPCHGFAIDGDYLKVWDNPTGSPEDGCDIDSSIDTMRYVNRYARDLDLGVMRYLNAVNRKVEGIAKRCLRLKDELELRKELATMREQIVKLGKGNKDVEMALDEAEARIYEMEMQYGVDR